MTLTQHQPVRNPRKVPGSEGSKNYDGAAARATQILPRLIAPVALAGAGCRAPRDMVKPRQAARKSGFGTSKKAAR